MMDLRRLLTPTQGNRAVCCCVEEEVGDEGRAAFLASFGRYRKVVRVLLELCEFAGVARAAGEVVERCREENRIDYKKIKNPLSRQFRNRPYNLSSLFPLKMLLSSSLPSFLFLCSHCNIVTVSSTRLTTARG